MRLCDDPKCPCHPRPPKPFQKLVLSLRGSKPLEYVRIDQPNAHLDVIFDLIGHSMTLRETVEDQTVPEASYMISMTMALHQMQFLNLVGLANNSLILTVRMRSAFCSAKGKEKMKYKEKYQGFCQTSHLDSRLYNLFYNCNWPQQELELILPKERCKGWKTIALILRTFNLITAENWCDIVNIRDRKTPPVAGFNWKVMEGDLMPKKEKKKKEKKEESSLVKTQEKAKEQEKELHFSLEKTKAKKAVMRQKVFVRC
ncbi:hypothetical protein BJX61DRAFT_543462 [Aspergillus egyptiacus]|nr:hypothetical protein BJX61DRAFT_543462 [Aspergillus egyptiacus]